MKSINEMTEQEIDAEIAALSAPKLRPIDQMSEQEIDEEIASLTGQQMDAQLPQQSNAPMAALQGFGQGATFGYLPQIQAGIAPAQQAVMGALTPGPTPSNVDEQLAALGFNMQQSPDTYLSRRDAAIAQQQALQESNPYAYGAGQLAGAIATSPVIPGGTAATTAGKIAQAAKTGAVYGAISNPGDIEGEINPLQLEERASQAAKGAALGAGTSAALMGAGKGLEFVAGGMKKVAKATAETKAVKAAGAMLKDFRKTMGKGITERIGRRLLDDGVVQAGDDVATIAQKASAIKEQAGKDISDFYSQVDNLAINIDRKTLSPQNFKLLAHSRLDAPTIANKMKRIIDTDLGYGFGTKTVKARINQELKEFSKNGNNLSLNQLRELRGSVDELVNWAKQSQDMPAIQQSFVKIRNEINNLIYKRVDAVSKVANNQSMSQNLRALNTRFSDYAEVTKIASDRVARESANQAFGLGEKLGLIGGGVIGAAGGGLGSLVGSLALMGATKLARARGNSLVAKSIDVIADKFMLDPQGLGRFAQPLAQALQKSPNDFVKVVQKYRLSDPEFKKMIYGNNGGGSDLAGGKKNDQKNRRPSGR